MRSGFVAAVLTVGCAAGLASAQPGPHGPLPPPGPSGPDPSLLAGTPPAQEGPVVSPFPGWGMPVTVMPVSAAPPPGPQAGTPAPAGPPAADAPAPYDPGPYGPVIFGGDCAPGCGPVWYVDAEFLYWLLESAPSNFPLATLGAPSGPNFAGVTVLDGDDDIDYDPFTGFRITTGLAFGAGGRWRLEGGAFYLPEQISTFRVSSGTSGDPEIARPIINPADNQLASLAVSLPNFASGSIAVRSTAQLWGGDAHLARACSPGPNSLFGSLVGFKYLDLEEDLTVEQRTHLFPGVTNPLGGATLTGPATLAVTDRFETRNQFYGPAVGGWFEWRKGKWVGLINGKVGLGVMHQVVQVSGETRGVPAGGTATTVPGGLLAQPSNIGRTVRDVFAAVPEAGVRIGYRFTDRLMGSIGYSFLYASDVVRPGDQIDPVVAPGQVPASSAFGTPGPNRPGRLFRQNDFWAHGFTVGLTCSY